MKDMSHIAARVLNKPLLLEPGYARTLFSALAPRLGITQLQDDLGELMMGEAMRMKAASFDSSRSRDRPYQVIDGVAVIPVCGSLVHKSGNLKPYSGMTGYDGIVSRAAMAFSDPDVRGVMLDSDTPGGEVSGCFDAARKLRELADTSGKPFWSLCYDMNCSAGMALASSANRRLITATGIAGSVGVVKAHASFEEQLEQEGVRVTLIHSGDRKVDGNPYQHLEADVLARFQAESDLVRNEFAALVSGHMGLSEAEVLATQAATYRGQEAIDIGFADQLVNGFDAVAEFSEYLSTQGRTISVGGSMENGGQQASVVDAGAVVESGGEGLSAGAAEQKRIAGILQSDAAKGREATANHLAFSTQMGATEAVALLETVPAAVSGSADMGTALDAAMAAEVQPEVGAGDSASVDEDPAAALVANWKGMTGQV